MNALIILTIFMLMAVSQQQEPLSPAAAAFWKELLSPVMEECLIETGVDSKLVERLIYYREFVEDRRLQCVMKCLGMKLNFINDKGELNVDRFTGLGIPIEIIKPCVHLRGADLCETAYKLGKCVYPAAAESVVGGQ